MRLPLALAALLLTACGGGGGSSADGQGPGQVPTSCPITSTPTTATWSGHVYPLLHSATCGSATVSCHGGATASGRLDYSADSQTLFHALVGQPSTTFNASGWLIVSPGDAAHSWLYEKVAPVVPGQPGLAATGSATGSQMPLGGSLCIATTDTIKIWINQGALNN